MRTTFAIALAFLLTVTAAHAQGVAPEMYGVREVILEPVIFDDSKAADTCSLTADGIVKAMTYVFKDAGVPVLLAADARPQSLGVARIQLIPEVYVHVDETLGCVSWVSLSAENHISAVIPPVSVLRRMTLLYWQQHTKVASPQGLHEQKVMDVLQQMALQFGQAYRKAQPADQAQ